ncbi:MAG: hypothetical protein GTN62_08470 [Gemmatimonadales bacterium]|nr:hypothetical protein [Gemmatimonadales bacterium]NIN50132.1 hypothetical protein [Gemmatimonadales bacterium]NIP07596.1 hypothetical protein [Gemmatimonadales bacterium]NIR01748.1 hypothetical protein [Gemmatimonadales bacterium]NIS65651.1 hypothetical protein [Gemmatimonadales bacterium]
MADVRGTAGSQGHGSHQPYTLTDWEEEAFATFGEGQAPGPCPECGRTGFYGPRVADPERRYRQCRFCGFTQDVGQPPTQYRPTAHSCGEWPQCARASYIWWVPPGLGSYRCPFCGEDVKVSEALVARPVDDPDHPWWRVPQRRKRFYYLRFWENWEYTKGRVHL